MFFQKIDSHAAIIVENGVYRQVDVYRRGNRLFAKVGSGFIRLMADGSTTKAKARLDAISIEKPLYKSRMGHLLLVAEEGAKQLSDERISKIIAPLGGAS